MNGWLLLAMTIDRPGPRWSPAMSDALDAAIMALRKHEARLSPLYSSTIQRTPGTSTIDANGPARGSASGTELRRRKLAARQLQRNADEDHQAALSAKRKAARAKRPGTVRWPKPRQKPNGRWQACCIHNGDLYVKTFDTREEAEQFITQIKTGKESA